MATVDQGGFGFRSPNQVPQTVQTPAGAFDQSGVEALGRSVTKVAGDVLDVQDAQRQQEFIASERTRRELEQKVKEENRARSAAALVDYDNGAKTIGEKVAQDLQSGAITREDVSSKFAEAEGKLRAETLGQIPADSQEFVVPRLAKVADQVQRGLGQIVEKHRQSEILGYAGSITDGMAKQAIEPGADINRIHSDYADAMRAIMPTGGAHPKEVDKAIQDFKDRTTVDYMVARENERIDDLPGLKDLKSMVLDTKAFPNIDPEKRNVLVHSVNSAIARLEAKQVADQARVMSELATDLQSQEKALMDGYPANPQQLISLQRRAKGTPLEEHFNRLASTNAYVSQFQNAPLDQMQSALLELDQKVRQAPTPDGIAMVSAMRSLVAAKQTGLKEDPYSTAIKDGAPLAVLDWTNPEGLKASFTSRVATVRAQQKQNPQASLGILLPAEATQFKEYLDTQAPKDQVKLLGVLTSAINDPVVTAHTMHQINKESPMLAQAGILVSWGHPDTATLLLDGQHLMLGKDGKHGAMTIPADDKFRTDWRSKVGNAYIANRDAEDQDFEAAKMIYVSLARTAGKTAQNDVDTGIWRKSIDLATGGIGDFNGENVVLPYGMDGSTFKKRAHEALDKAFQSREIAGAAAAGIKPIIPENETTAQRYHRLEQEKAQATGQQYGLNTTDVGQRPGSQDAVTPGTLSRDFLKDLPLESVGQGVYRVHNGSGYIVNDEGYPLLLDLSRPVPGYRWDTRARIQRPVTYEEASGGAAAVRGAPLEDILQGGPQPTPIQPHTGTPVELSPDTAAPIDKTQIRRDKKPPKKGGG